MPTLLIIVGFSLLILPGIFRYISSRIDARRWTLLCVFSLGTGLVLVETGLLAFAATSLVANDHRGCSSDCVAMMARLAPGGILLGWAALLVAGGVAILAIRTIMQIRRTRAITRVEAFVGDHSKLGRHELIVLSTPQPVALCVKGDPGQVLISEGLLSSLEDAEITAILQHERAHLDYSHHRYLLLASSVEGAFAKFSLVRRSADALRLGVERWADEIAASNLPDGRVHVRSALLRTAGIRIDPALAGFSEADTIVERLKALGEPLPDPSFGLRGLLYTPGILLELIAAIATSAWVGQMHLLLLMVDRCHL